VQPDVVQFVPDDPLDGVWNKNLFAFAGAGDGVLGFRVHDFISFM
jgi:hypothetical protein